MSLDAAIRQLHASNVPYSRLFARERVGGGRTYVIMTPEEAWAETCSKAPAHLYEVLTGPCHFYLDIEWTCAEQPADAVEHTTVNNIVAQAKSKVEQKLSCQVEEARVTASGKLANGKYKCSWHVHLFASGVSWASAHAVGKFVRTYLSQFPQVDMSPYSGQKQNWRCVGSAKATDPSRTLKPVCKETFMKCLVQPSHANIRLVGDEVSPTCSTLLLSNTNEVVRTILHMFPNVRQEAVAWAVPGRFLILPFLRQMCPIAGRVHRSNHQYAIVDVLAMRWRHKCHNATCASKVSQWQAMPNFDAAKRALGQKCVVTVPDFTTSPCGSSDTSPLTAMRARGPPPQSLLNKHSTVRCINGSFYSNGR